MPTVWAVSQANAMLPFLHRQKRAAAQKNRRNHSLCNAWNTFDGGVWQQEINVRDFIQKQLHPV